MNRYQEECRSKTVTVEEALSHIKSSAGWSPRLCWAICTLLRPVPPI